MDENGIMEGQGLNGLCVGKAETKVALAKHPESRIWTTILECVSATGRLFNPLVIFKGKEVQQQWFPDDQESLASLSNWMMMMMMIFLL
jgi:4-hydroxybenzoate polyprenyltransferase